MTRRARSTIHTREAITMRRLCVMAHAAESSAGETAPSPNSGMADDAGSRVFWQVVARPDPGVGPDRGARKYGPSDPGGPTVRCTAPVTAEGYGTGTDNVACYRLSRGRELLAVYGQGPHPSRRAPSSTTPWRSSRLSSNRRTTMALTIFPVGSTGFTGTLTPKCAAFSCQLPLTP